MGFSMVCKTTGKNCSYSTWYQQRTEIIKVTMKYLEAKILEVQEKLQEIGDDDGEIKINDFPPIQYDYFITRLNEVLIEPIKKCRNDENIFKILEYKDIYHIKEEMTAFGIYGIHLLCKQGDCGGVYTVGESYDILELLRVIKPYFDKSSEIYETVYNINSIWSSPIYNIFYDSVSTCTPIRIT
jgi:hypothetical protein